MTKNDLKHLAFLKKHHLRSLEVHKEDWAQAERIIAAGRGKWTRSQVLGPDKTYKRLAVLWEGETEYAQGC